MDIKKGDNVIIGTGKDSGKRGKVMAVNAKANTVVVEGLHMFKKHKRPTKQGQKGETVSIARPMSRANVMIFCSSCKRGARVGMRVEGDNKTRICTRCKTVL